MMRLRTTPTLAALLLAPLAAPHAAMPDFQSHHLAVGLSRSAPAVSVFAVDSLGQGKLDQNPVLAETNAVPGLELEGGLTYKLNILQVNPRLQMLANNASSDAVPFTLFEYPDVALCAPPLAEGLTRLDLVRMTLDRYLAGAKGYGQTGYGGTPTDADLIPWKTPWTSLDTLPSLLISACNYANGGRDWNWARANYDKLLA